MSYFQSLLFLCPVIFLAGFIDSVAGGGGILSLPAYLFAGLPAHSALGCNKFSSSVGTTFSAARYFVNGALDLKIALLAAAGAFLGSTAGSKLALILNERTLKTILLFVLPCAAAVILFRKSKNTPALTHAEAGGVPYIQAFFIGLLIGGYDGLIGPGTGTFAALAFTMLMGYDWKTSAGNAKVLNLASNYAAVITFILAGSVVYKIAVPAAVCGIAGNYLGSGLAIKKGAHFIRPMLIFVLILIFVKMVADLFF